MSNTDRSGLGDHEGRRLPQQRAEHLAEASRLVSALVPPSRQAGFDLPSLLARFRLTLAGPAGTVLAAWAASRVLVLLAAVAAESVLPRTSTLTSGSGGPILTSLTSWDGWWYLGIERSGYHVPPLTGLFHDYAFFPLYPALVRVLSLMTPAFDGLVAVLLSNLLFLVALRLLYTLTAEVLDVRRALAASVLLCIFPFSWVFSMAYGESLFLALSLGSLLAAERGRAGRACVLASLAGLTRLPGVLLTVPLAMILWRRLVDRRSMACLVVVPIGAVMFGGFVTSMTGSLSAYGAAQTAWGRAGVGAAAAGGQSLGSNLDLLLVTLLVTMLAYVFMLVYLRPDGIPLAYSLIPIMTLALVFLSGSLYSIGRLGMVAFPYLWIVAGRRSARFRSAWPALSAGLLGMISAAIFAGWYQP